MFTNLEDHIKSIVIKVLEELDLYHAPKTEAGNATVSGTTVNVNPAGPGGSPTGGKTGQGDTHNK